MLVFFLFVTRMTRVATEATEVASEVDQVHDQTKLKLKWYALMTQSLRYWLCTFGWSQDTSQNPCPQFFILLYLRHRRDCRLCFLFLWCSIVSEIVILICSSEDSRPRRRLAPSSPQSLCDATWLDSERSTY